MTAGRLRRRISFQKKEQVSDGGGGFAEDWVTQFTVWGGLQPERSRERMEAGRLEAATAGTLRVRSNPDTRQADVSWRVEIGSEPYQIRSITNPDQRGKFLELNVERGVAQ